MLIQIMFACKHTGNRDHAATLANHLDCFDPFTHTLVALLLCNVVADYHTLGAKIIVFEVKPQIIRTVQEVDQSDATRVGLVCNRILRLEFFDSATLIMARSTQPLLIATFVHQTV